MFLNLHKAFVRHGGKLISFVLIFMR